MIRFIFWKEWRSVWRMIVIRRHEKSDSQSFLLLSWYAFPCDTFVSIPRFYIATQIGLALYYAQS